MLTYWSYIRYYRKLIRFQKIVTARLLGGGGLEKKTQFHLGLEGTLLLPFLSQTAPSGSKLKLLVYTQEHKLHDPEIKVTHNPTSFGKLKFFLQLFWITINLLCEADVQKKWNMKLRQTFLETGQSINHYHITVLHGRTSPFLQPVQPFYVILVHKGIIASVREQVRYSLVTSSQNCTPHLLQNYHSPLQKNIIFVAVEARNFLNIPWCDSSCSIKHRYP